MKYMKADINELELIKSQIDSLGNELIASLAKIINETENTKNFFDSRTGDAFRKEVISYLNGRIDYIQKNYLSFNNKLDMIIGEYTEFHNSVSEMVGDTE